MGPMPGPLDPLELALLLRRLRTCQASTATRQRRSTRQTTVTRTTGTREVPLPRRYIRQILRAYDRGGRKAASRTGQRVVARGLVKSLLGRRRNS